MAYEVKALAEKLKEKGIDVAEEVAIEAVKAVSEWAQTEAKKGEKPIVDAVVLIAAPQLEKVLVDLADKIDGKEG
jgi:translation initiation factor 2B subunit (eIF-2B alpha/beta/delta family)